MIHFTNCREFYLSVFIWNRYSSRESEIPLCFREANASGGSLIDLDRSKRASELLSKRMQLRKTERNITIHVMLMQRFAGISPVIVAPRVVSDCNSVTRLMSPRFGTAMFFLHAPKLAQSASSRWLFKGGLNRPPGCCLHRRYGRESLESLIT
jgi:hypothetical protein